jgi:hypothetical protein
MTSRNFLFIILLGAVLACCAGDQTLPDVAVDILPQYDLLFSNKDGWTGADGAYSAALSPDTVAWFFGDTWIGQIKKGRHINATLIHNSAAIQRGKNPATATLDFYYDHAADGSPAALFQPADGRGWLWVLDGVMTSKGLFVFLIQVERTAADTPFNFEVIGAWLGHVANPLELPAGWRIRQSRIPWAEFSASAGILWGSALLQIDDFLYIYGTAEDRRSGVHQKRMILARAPAAELADFSRWRFFAAGSWVSDFRRASRLCENIPTEYSVSYLPALKRYVAVYSQDGLSRNILARLSATPEGPWSDPIRLYQCAEAQWGGSIFCYAAKAHAILSRGTDQLIITYIANSADFNITANDDRLYRPRFLRVTFSSKKN